MALLLNLQSEERIRLEPYHTFGRLRGSVNTCLADPYVSKIHAVVEWDGVHWQIRDLSSNGTWRNGRRMLESHNVQLKVDDILRFAKNDGLRFKVLSLTPPRDLLVAIGHNGGVIELNEINFFDSDKSAGMLLTFNPKSNSWWLEELSDDLNWQTAAEEVKDKQRILMDGKIWQLQMCSNFAETFQLKPCVSSVDDITFIMHTSQDEETTKVTIDIEGQMVNLKALSHHYLTLLLARQLAQDIQKGFPKSEQGWVYAESLATDLGFDASHLNIQIYRIRKQFLDALSHEYDSINIIERTSGKLRLAIKNFIVKKGDVVEFDTRNMAGIRS